MSVHRIVCRFKEIRCERADLPYALTMKHTRRFLLLGSVACLAACQTTPSLMVDDRLVWSSEPVLVAKGLEPGQTYQLTTERRSFWDSGATERSVLTFTADPSGIIDTSKLAPEGETEASAYAPVRDMAYLAGEATNDLEPLQLRFRLNSQNGDLSLDRIVAIGPDPERLKEEPLGEAFIGAYILRLAEAAGPQPAIVLLGGSEGGDRGSRATAPVLAAEGFTVLGLPYYSPAWFGQEQQFPGLSKAFANLPVDYLESAVTELRKRQDVIADKIMLHGGSKGAEFVLLAGSLIPDESMGGGFCGIVADVPSDVVWEGWGAGETVSSFSWRGEPLPFVPYQDMSRALDRSDSYTMTEAHENGRKANPDRLAAARIPVERIDEPVLLIGGDKDTTWASGPMSRTLKATREEAGLETELYVYPEGGHGVGGSPLVRTTKANLAARLESFPAVIAFHKRAAQRDSCRN